MELKPHLRAKLTTLRLSGILDTLEVRTQHAITEHWSYADFLERLLEDEVERRAQKQLTGRLRRATLNTAKTLETFDFSFNASLNRQQVYDLATCQFVHDKRNVLICGPTGVGKSHLAQALAQAACRQGLDVLFGEAYKLLRHLAAGRADHTYDKRLALYARADLLVIDDFGLKPMQPPAAQDLYDLITERYEKGAIILTSNRAPTEWATWFADPLLASAGLDRLAHRAHVLLMSGASYRAKDRPSLDEKGGALN
jgi:DNA replication protein DnaC